MSPPTDWRAREAPQEPWNARSQRARTAAASSTPSGRSLSGPLTFTRPDGATDTLSVAFGVDEIVDAPYRLRRVTDTVTGDEYLQKWIPELSLNSSVDVSSYDILDNEIQIGLHLIRSLRGHDYPRELSRLVGYEADGDEPFVLLAERGQPAERIRPGLRLDNQERFQISLMRALNLLWAIGVVHRAITPNTVRWDDPYVQITDFRHAALVGEPRGQAPNSMWAAPESRRGGGLVDHREDIWSAGLVVYQVVAGPRSPGHAEPPDLAKAPGGIDETLRGIFDEAVGQRPGPQEILRRLNAVREVVPPDLVSASQLGDPAFTEGEERFDSLARAKKERFGR